MGATLLGGGGTTATAAPSVGSTGYWFVAGDGGIFSYGPGALFDGSTGNIALAAPVVGMAATPDGGGYWMVAADGGVFAFGNAGFFGSAGGTPQPAPFVAITTTHDGLGYWLLRADGRVFAFGDATYAGDAFGLLTVQAVAMQPTPDANGYWIVDLRGNVFPFHAPSLGQPGMAAGGVAGMAVTTTGAGYWIVSESGQIFSFGDAVPMGDASHLGLAAQIVGMAATPDGNGYYLLGRDGGVFSYGDAPFFGSTGNIHLNSPVVGMAVPASNGTIHISDHAIGGRISMHVGTHVIVVLHAPGNTGWGLSTAPSAAVLVTGQSSNTRDNPSAGAASASTWLFPFTAVGVGSTTPGFTENFPGTPTGVPPAVFTFTANVVP